MDRVDRRRITFLEFFSECSLVSQCTTCLVGVSKMKRKLTFNLPIGIHITCTTDTAQTLTHPTLINNIFASTLGIKCVLPVSYARQQPRAAPAEPHLSHHFINSRHRAWCSFRLLLHPNTHCVNCCWLLDFVLDFFLDFMDIVLDLIRYGC